MEDGNIWSMLEVKCMGNSINKVIVDYIGEMGKIWVVKCYL